MSHELLNFPHRYHVTSEAECNWLDWLDLELFVFFHRFPDAQSEFYTSYFASDFEWKLDLFAEFVNIANLSYE